MNKEFFKGMFIGGILALIIAAFMSAFDLFGLSCLIFVIIIDIIMAINLAIDKYYGGEDDESN